MRCARGYPPVCGEKADQHYQCPVCDALVMERIDVHVQGVNDHEGYRERLHIVNSVVTRVLSDACKHCYMISPVSYPLICNSYDVNIYLSKSTQELEMIVMQSLQAVLKDTNS